MSRYAYTYELNDKTKGCWITDCSPKIAGYELPKRFVGRKVVLIKRMGKKK